MADSGGRLELALPVFESLADAFLHPVVGGSVISPALGEIGLRHIAAFEIVGVMISQLLVGGSAGGGEFFPRAGAEVFRHGEGAAFLDVLHGLAERGVGAVGFRRGGEIDRGMGERDAAFRHADEFECLLGGDGDAEGIRIGEADVLAGGNHQTPGDETRILAGVQHLREPVERGIGIRAADGFDEGGGGVVMRVAIGIVGDGFLLDAFLGDFEAQLDASIAARRGGEHGEFEGGEGFADIAIRHFREVAEGVGRDIDLEVAEAAVGVAERAFEHRDEIGGGHGFELEDLRA